MPCQPPPNGPPRHHPPQTVRKPLGNVSRGHQGAPRESGLQEAGLDRLVLNGCGLPPALLAPPCLALAPPPKHTLPDCAGLRVRPPINIPYQACNRRPLQRWLAAARRRVAVEVAEGTVFCADHHRDKPSTECGTESRLLRSEQKWLVVHTDIIMATRLCARMRIHVASPFYQAQVSAARRHPRELVCRSTNMRWCPHTQASSFLSCSGPRLQHSSPTASTAATTTAAACRTAQYTGQPQPSKPAMA